ncbi:MAG: SDR family NAD(P)-dependent oxidoreductase, partial [Alphaproteobacteria bacterium]|nr:SDR family NAD(P)-dependent oxidoreductase [Alphaproteobacteria bacterium]
ERATAAAAKMDGARVIAAPGDVTAPDDRASMFETVRAAFGAVDILVNNAGVITGGMPIRKFETLDEADFRAQIDLNYLAVTGMTRLALCARRIGAASSISPRRAGGSAWTSASRTTPARKPPWSASPGWRRASSGRTALRSMPSRSGP